MVTFFKGTTLPRVFQVAPVREENLVVTELFVRSSANVEGVGLCEVVCRRRVSCRRLRVCRRLHLGVCVAVHERIESEAKGWRVKAVCDRCWVRRRRVSRH